MVGGCGWGVACVPKAVLKKLAPMLLANEREEDTYLVHPEQQQYKSDINTEHHLFHLWEAQGQVNYMS